MVHDRAPTASHFTRNYRAAVQRSAEARHRGSAPCRSGASFLISPENVGFALHPLHVESVAWVSERKDVLSAFFGLLTLHAWVSYAREPSRRAYGLGNRLWHTDASFQDPPGRYSMLSAKIVPSVAADTEYADMRAAYDALPAEIKARCEGLRVHHSIAHSRQTLGFEFSQDEQEALKGAIHPLIRTIPRSLRRSLYVASHASRIIDWPVPRGGCPVHEQPGRRIVLLPLDEAVERDGGGRPGVGLESGDACGNGCVHC